MGDGPQELYRAPDPSGIFELVDLLGEGSYGAVYKGRHIRTGEIVAIKVIDLVDDEIAEIWAEINFLRICKHANIVKYFGTYLRHDKLWIAMELCSGGSVMDLYKENGKGLKEEQISYIMYESLKGLAYLHEKGIIHRDIKAGNILLTADCEVKLADFGVSGLMTSSQPRRKTFIGTPYWMAPEVIACDKDDEADYNEKCDIWGLGITAIEMADMDPPLADLHPLRALFLIPANKPPSFSQPKKWSKNCRDFLKQCLIKDPAKRPSAKQLLEHPFVKPKSNTVNRARHSLEELVDRIVNKNNPPATESVVSEDPEFDIDEAGSASAVDIQSKETIQNRRTARKMAAVRGTLSANTALDMAFSDVPSSPPPLRKDSAQQKEEELADTIAIDAWQNLMGRASVSKGRNEVIKQSQFVAEPLDDDDDDNDPGFSNPLFSNPMFKVSSKVDVNDEPDTVAFINPLAASNQPEPASFIASSPMNVEINNDVEFTRLKEDNNTPIPPAPISALPAVPNSQGTGTQSKKTLAKLMGTVRGLPPIPAPPETVEEASIETLQHLPFTNRATKKGTQRLNAQLAAIFKEDAAISTFPPNLNGAPVNKNSLPSMSDSDVKNMQVKALNLAKNFPFEITCSTTYGSRYLFGSPVGLFQLDKSGQLQRIVSNTRFSRISVIEEYGVMVAICGRHQHIRMYSLQELFSNANKNRRASILMRRNDPFQKIKGTKHSTFYSIVRSKGTVFMVAAARNMVVLFMWADYPFNKFMKIKDFYVPENVRRVHPIISSDGKLSQLAIQSESRFLTIHIDTSEPDTLSFPVVKKSQPLLLQPINQQEMLVAFTRSGFILDTDTLQAKPVMLNWRFVPLSVVSLKNDMILAFSPKMIDVFSKHTGEVIQTIRHKDSKKIRYLFTQHDDVFVAAKNAKQDISSVYVMRAVPLSDTVNDGLVDVPTI